MASSAITSWQMEGEKVETLTDYIFLGCKITVDGGCMLKYPSLLLRKKAMRNLASVLKKAET